MLPPSYPNVLPTIWYYRVAVVSILIALFLLPPVGAAALGFSVGLLGLAELSWLSQWRRASIIGFCVLSAVLSCTMALPDLIAWLVLVNICAHSERLRRTPVSALPLALATGFPVAVLAILIPLAFCRALPVLLLAPGLRTSCMLLVSLAFLQDFTASAVGKRFRFGALAPALSERKTVSGALAGFIVSGTIAVICVDGVPATGKLLFLLLAAASDLLFSWVKRIVQVKDFSNLFGAKGGLLDRIDSLALPIVYLFVATQAWSVATFAHRAYAV